MAPRKKTSALLTVRIDATVARTLAREARKRGTTRSEVARSILAAGLGIEDKSATRAVDEARRQSLRVSRRRSERETLEFIEHAADTWGWS
jgi:hypothetical protein